MNPKFEKRWKEGEDNLYVDDKFICCLDGVGGWSDVLYDSGALTKELIPIIEQVYKSGEYKDI